MRELKVNAYEPWWHIWLPDLTMFLVASFCLREELQMSLHSLQGFWNLAFVHCYCHGRLWAFCLVMENCFHFPQESVIPCGKWNAACLTSLASVETQSGNAWLHGAVLIVFIPLPIVTVLAMLDFNFLFHCLPSLYYIIEGRENSCQFFAAF